MTLATLGWGVVWASLGLSRLGVQVPPLVIYGVSGLLAAAGFAYGVLTMRSRRAWLYMAAVALFANGTLLALPFVFHAELEAALGAH